MFTLNNVCVTQIIFEYNIVIFNLQYNINLIIIRLALPPRQSLWLFFLDLQLNVSKV